MATKASSWAEIAAIVEMSAGGARRGRAALGVR